MVQVAIALIRQYQLLSNLSQKRGDVLSCFEASMPTQENGFQGVFDIYNYAFALLDAVVRYHKMAHSLPGVSKKEVLYRRLDKAIDHFKGARNQIQHLDNDVVNEFSGPLMGAVTWPNDVTNYSAVLNDVGRERKIGLLAFDTVEGKFVNGFCYVYNDKYYDLDAAVSAINTFHADLMSRMVLKVGETDFDPLSNISVLHVSYRRKQI
jgi:hypothetical protein